MLHAHLRADTMTARILQFVSIAVSAACLGVLAQDLALRRAGDELRVAAPRLHFLTGKPLERMRNGASVTYDMQLSILSDTRQVTLRRGFERFVLSYDLWEERFSVTRVRTVRASAAHLTAEAAESWCLEHISVPEAGLATDRPVYVRLDVRALEEKDRRRYDDEDVLSLGRLIDLFSRAGAPPPGTSWRAEAGPIRLQNVKP
jgi:hypothetical protein